MSTTEIEVDFNALRVHEHEVLMHFYCVHKMYELDRWDMKIWSDRGGLGHSRMNEVADLKNF